ncbi:unnamed protein product [Brassica napus]|uniref:(rape) hypothetical protein n=1 Tax=Brassica napus TaxID=3708 RepID=A0A816QAJ6_BRANA|nr:unnamed protein product [Brassica napus]
MGGYRTSDRAWFIHGRIRTCETSLSTCGKHAKWLGNLCPKICEWDMCSFVGQRPFCLEMGLVGFCINTKSYA